MRRALAAGLLLITLAAAPAAPAAEATNWRADAARTGASPERLPPTLRRAWRTTLPGQSSAPLVVRGRVLVAVSTTDGQAELLAYSARTGRLLWSEQLAADEPGIASTGGRVFAVGDGGAVHAFDVRSGRSLWSARLPEARFCGSPAAEGPTLVIDCAAGIDPGIFALDPRDGHVVWATPYGEGDAAPAVAGGIVVIAGDCTRVQARDRATGALVWGGGSQCGGGGLLASIHGGLVYTRENHDPAFVDDPVLDVNTGARRRVLSTDAYPALAGGLGAFMQAGELRVEDLASGAVRWRSRGDGRFGSAPFIVAGRAFVLSWSGGLFAFDAATGRLVQRITLPALAQQDRREITAGSRRLVVLTGTTLSAFR